MSFTSEDIRKLIAEQEVEVRTPGTVLFSQSRYDIQRVLGEGGMGVTCLANEYSSGNLKRPVVLKFVKDSLDPRRLEQFLNEVQLSILFNHPNLVPIYRLESETLSVIPPKVTKITRRRPHEHKMYYAVMQYIDGWNLRELVNRLRELGITLNHDLAMFIIARVARGLNYVHEYHDENNEHIGLVHRDVSPENILIDRFGRVKVADFGIAVAVKQARTDVWLKAGKMLYCSPEQMDGARLDKRSDIYNIGLLMYYLFTNNDRFGAEMRLERSRERIRRKMTRSPLSHLKKVTPRLAHICELCLRENPDERYQSCEDLATDIDIYFKETQKVLTNEQLEEMLQDLFSPHPTFVSRRFIPISGSPRLEQPGYDASMDPQAEEQIGPLPTILLDEDD